MLSLKRETKTPNLILLGLVIFQSLHDYNINETTVTYSPAVVADKSITRDKQMTDFIRFLFVFISNGQNQEKSGTMGSSSKQAFNNTDYQAIF